jgi:hypothetical protein
MRLKLGGLVVVSFLAGAGCTQSSNPIPTDSPSGTGGSSDSHEGTGGSSRGGSTGSGGNTSSSGTGGSSSGTGGSESSGTGGSSSSGTGGGSGSNETGGTTGSADAATDATTGTDSGTDTGGSSDPGSYNPNVDGPIPPYKGPPVGPEVKMDCPGDPLAGFTEYDDTFKIERPYDLMVKDRFSIEGGVYTFFVKQGDKKHNPTSTAKNPRTEARYSQNFRTGIRMFSGDVFWEKSVSNGSVVMQVHTTTTGIGPVYMVANGNNVNPINGSKVPGGLYDRWINLKVLINAGTTASQYWINNCPVASMGSGVRGDGNNYFKMGVYHCDSGTCRAKWKNVKLYMKN